MKNVFSIAVALVLALPIFGFQVQSFTGAKLGTANKLRCAKAPCYLSGDTVTMGGTSSVIAATATTLTAAQCGSVFKNSGAVQVELPALSSSLIGCEYTFITGNATNFDVNPADADSILGLTNAAGDAIRNATLGNSVTLKALSATGWAPIGIYGTWTDIN